MTQQLMLNTITFFQKTKIFEHPVKCHMSFVTSHISPVICHQSKCILWLTLNKILQPPILVSNVEACRIFSYFNRKYFSVLVTYIKGQRHKPYLIIDEYKFIKHRSSQKTTYWKCHMYDSGMCKARLTTHWDQTIKFSSEHSHVPYERYDSTAIINKEFYKVLP